METYTARPSKAARSAAARRYLIDRHVPASAFHRALHVSYPSPSDIARARQGGYAPGGDIMVHGIRNGLGWVGRTHLVLAEFNSNIAGAIEVIAEFR